ncbi:hypothetical protein ABEB36_000956 [Hypothenemus hampei]|uniref:WAPL domain-containing protein n=1 Tax=Hypothenemus hampei TaxID=57062 RepID=A0ABD1FDL8_HYPHA
MSRGFGKYRRGASHHSFHFDALFKENSSRPSAARSAASVGKWGITSFTSIRTLNGRQESESGKESVPKPKKFFKSRDSSQDANNASSPSYQDTSSYGSAPKKARRTYDSDRPTRSSPKKFFSSKNTQEKVVVTLNQQAKRRNSDRSDSSESSKPPIVLRICRGKSQLISDEEGDKPVPSSPSSSTSMSSPRALRETSNSQPQQQTTSPRPSNCRITRSARRSMQMDPNSSPVTADTPAELNMFPTSKKDTVKGDLSPQYVPAEKFEEERRAMYASLLKPDSPEVNFENNDTLVLDEEEDKKQGNKSIEEAMEELHGGIEGDPAKTSSDQGETEMEIDETISNKSPIKVGSASEDVKLEQKDGFADTETIENIAKEIESTKVAVKQTVSIPGRELRKRVKQKDIKDNLDEVPIEEKRSGIKARHKTINDDDGNDVLSKDKVKSTKRTAAIKPSAAAPEELVEELSVIPKPNKSLIEGEWDTDSDSNSTAPDPEVKETKAETSNPEPVPMSENKMEITEKPPEPPSVKLVISKKKGSIFKSRAFVNDDSKKRRARYVHKWTDREGGETPARPPIENAELDSEFDFKGDPLTRITLNDDSQDTTRVKCTKTDKSYYTVVRNVKKAHQIQEIGEFQEFNDDVEYILDALQDNNPISTRCLSAITLASKCMAPAFRMHVRAHGTVAKFFKALHDATKDASLGLCTATVMFVLSQDRLNMDLDRDCLELMLNLLESDVGYQQALDVCGLSTGQLEKNKQKVRELCAEIQSQGHAMHLNLDSITTGQLAMETLLSLTSKRAGEWFKEELRELGGLEHIMKTIHECCRQVSDYVVSWTDVLLDKLRKVDRCLRVLENVTQNNEENQTYILKYNDGIMVDTLANLYKLCDGEIPLYPITDIADKSSTGTIVREALLVTLKVLINLTHHYRQQSVGSQLIGSKPGIVDTSLHLLLQVPNYIPEQKKFELGVLVLMFLINLIQDQEANKKLLMEAKAPPKLESIYSREESAVEALIVQFYEWEKCAKIAENKTNAILDGEKDDQDQAGTEAQPQNQTKEEFIEETVAKLLQKAGTHMEFTFLASYIVMLIGFLIMDNDTYQTSIRQHLRGNNFTDMVDLLKKFFNFMNLTASTEASSVCAVKATQKVIKFLESCDGSECTSNSNSQVKQEIGSPVVPYL